jgi:hypothetical protein
MPLKIIPTPDYIITNYGDVGAVYLIEAGPWAGKHACCLSMMFTVGIAVMDADQWYARWCYDKRIEALKALTDWDGMGDPGGPWIKYKGRGGERHGPGSTAEVRE